MIYDRAELLELLAADYVVGTLRGAARRRFERVCLGSAAAQGARNRWEDRLATLSLRLNPIEPREQVWQRIRDQIGATRITPKSAPARARFGFKTYLPLAAAAALVGIAVWLGPRLLQAPTSTQVVAVLGVDTTHPQWRIERSTDAHRVRVVTVAAMTASSQKAYELWALPRDGKPPVSLGLLPLQGEIARELSAPQSAAILAAGKLAVSVEPPGGSPTGAPTGPVIMVSAVVNS